MTQFDVFVNPIGAARRTYPFVVALQSDLSGAAAGAGGESVVAPLAPRKNFGPLPGRLLPNVSVSGQDHVVMIPSMSAMPSRDLQRPVANLRVDRQRLLAAVDLLFFGV